MARRMLLTQGDSAESDGERQDYALLSIISIILLYIVDGERVVFM